MIYILIFIAGVIVGILNFILIIRIYNWVLKNIDAAVDSIKDQP